MQTMTFVGRAVIAGVLLLSAACAGMGSRAASTEQPAERVSFRAHGVADFEAFFGLIQTVALYHGLECATPMDDGRRMGCSGSGILMTVTTDESSASGAVEVDVSRDVADTVQLRSLISALEALFGRGTH